LFCVALFKVFMIFLFSFLFLFFNLLFLFEVFWSFYSSFGFFFYILKNFVFVCVLSYVFVELWNRRSTTQKKGGERTETKRKNNMRSS
jgi:hypothetical protein